MAQGIQWQSIQSNPIQSNPIQSNPIQSNPINTIQSNPIQSNPIQSNPIQSNPIQSNPIQSNGTLLCASVSTRTCLEWERLKGKAGKLPLQMRKPTRMHKQNPLLPTSCCLMLLQVLLLLLLSLSPALVHGLGGRLQLADGEDPAFANHTVVKMTYAPNSCTDVPGQAVQTLQPTGSPSTIPQTPCTRSVPMGMPYFVNFVAAPVQATNSPSRTAIRINHRRSPVCPPTRIQAQPGLHKTSTTPMTRGVARNARQSLPALGRAQPSQAH